MKAFIFLAVAIACALAAEEPERVKKDVVIGAHPYAYGAYPYAYGAYPYHYGYDDGKYYPGKYEKATIMPTAYSAGYYGAYPYSYNYGAYPYNHFGYNYPLAARMYY